MAFDWDNIDCASPDLENSAQFFSVRHIEHEKDYNDYNTKIMFKENVETVEKIQQIVEEKAEEAQIVDKKTSVQNQEKVKNEFSKKIPLKTRVDLQNAAPKNFSKIPKKILEKHPAEKPKNNVVESKKQATTKSLVSRVNLVKNTRPMKADLPQQIKKAHEFRAKPAPNFKLLHEKQKKIVKPQQAITIPHTPIFLRKSQAPNPRKKLIPEPQKQKDFRKVMKVGKVVAAKREPFRPKKEIKITQVVPFNLQTTRRQEERRRFDDLTRQMRDLKTQRDMKEKKKQEDDLRKELRKKTEFRARPNPFK